MQPGRGTLATEQVTKKLNMVGIVQLVERQIVVLVVVGSSPSSHPRLEQIEICSFLFLM